jgi:hypothetical protein
MHQPYKEGILMKKQSFIRVFVLLLCATLFLTACSEESGGGGSSKKANGNTYETPIKIMEDLANAKKATDFTKELIAQLNGLAEDEIKAIFKALAKSEDNQDQLADSTEQHQDRIDDMKDEYGEDYKVIYKIEDKKKLDKEDLNHFRDQINYYIEEQNTLVENTESFDSDEWKNLADFLGMSMFDAKAYISALDDLCQELDDINVEEGFKLRVVISLRGSELDEPKDSEVIMRVYKVNSRWISENVASNVYSYINTLVYN